ncbi:FIST N-terminal domain-containing protein [Sulfitobacter pacificus]|uniref:FIST N-terminal domain-containing protein n=1 Tax=Sulfitobacter pacificus TaxID=1499314 RepID=UPI003605C30B
MRLQERNPDLNSNFAFLVVDGMSLSEDALTATISPALREMPLFGGSAGDGTDFRRALVALNGKVAVSAAVLTLVRSRYRTQVFSLDHLIPSEEQMVVTEADPERRIVKSINAEPAAREYARIVGKDPDQLDRFTFASHPVVVRIGAAHHVRAIQQVNDAGELVFFSAIDEGMVLTVASPQNMVDHLHNKMADLSDQDKPAHILGCDCILRRIEAEQRQMTRDLSNVMASYNVTGFSTYGEQIGPLHVNHTMSGVAIYAAED